MRIAFISIFVGFLAVSCDVAAQQYRYMDSSGNINFVDSLSDVPRRYREQIVPPTPTPVLDRRGLQEKRRLENQARREQMAAERQERVEKQRQEREERERLRVERERLRREQQRSGFRREL
ncbi:MAG: hypothetical protein ACK5Y6_09385 [Pseudomonadota bacterium]|jgi:hypothetical protein